MKSLTLFLFSLVFCIYANAQEDKEGNNLNYKRFSIPNMYEVHLDSLKKAKSLKLDSSMQKGVNAISIPNAYSKQENIMYNIPIKKLSGKGLAPMPGTENLDKLENSVLLDSLKTKNNRNK